MRTYIYQPPTTRSRTGYGEFFESLALALTRFCGDEFLFVRPGISPETFNPDLEIFVGQPYLSRERSFKEPRAKVRGVYTMYERKELLQDMVDGIRAHFQFIIVPSLWCFELFQRTFPDLPIYYCPPVIDVDRYHFTPRPFDREPFTMLWQGYNFQDRKGREIVEQAFSEAALPNARLIVKMQALSSFSKAEFALCDAQSRTTYVSDNCYHVEKLGLWRECDFGIMPSRGEGIGLMPMEWMATGLPCAFADNTGASDFCDTRFNYPLQCDDLYTAPDGITAEVPSVKTVVDIMRYAYENREDLGKRAAMARLWIQQEFAPNIIARRFNAVVNQIGAEFGLTQSKENTNDRTGTCPAETA